MKITPGVLHFAGDSSEDPWTRRLRRHRKWVNVTVTCQNYASGPSFIISFEGSRVDVTEDPFKRRDVAEENRVSYPFTWSFCENNSVNGSMR